MKEMDLRNEMKGEGAGGRLYDGCLLLHQTDLANNALSSARHILPPLDDSNNDPPLGLPPGHGHGALPAH